MALVLDPLAVDSSEEEDEITTTQGDSDNLQWEHQELAHVQIRSLKGHTNTITSCHFFENDTRILTSSWDGTIRLWSVDTASNISTIRPHPSRCSKAKLSSNKRSVISCGWDKRVKLTDLETGQVKWERANRGIVTCCDCSPNETSSGNLVASGADLIHTITIWDERSGDPIKEIRDLHTNTIMNLNFNSKSDRLVSCGMDKSVRLFDLRTYTNTITLNGHRNIISDAQFSQDERHLASVGWDKRVCIWDISTGKYRSNGPNLVPKGHQGSISACRFTYDSSKLITCGYDCLVKIWDLNDDKPVERLTLNGHSDWIECVDVSKDSNWIISGGKDTLLKLWNVSDSETIPIVIQSQKNTISTRMASCSKCGKPFSKSNVLELNDNDVCVFCRLENQHKQYDY